VRRPDNIAPLSLTAAIGSDKNNFDKAGSKSNGKNSSSRKPSMVVAGAGLVSFQIGNLYVRLRRDLVRFLGFGVSSRS